MFDVNNMRKEYRRDVKKIQGEISFLTVAIKFPFYL
jgi:hypothetical protein